ncbi:prolyl oligopeptidase family serine peptidase [soil metagenome]
MTAIRFAFFALFAFTPALFADGPADNKPENVRPVPPKGSAIPDATRAELKAGLADLNKEIDALRQSLKAPNAELLPDVEIYHKAVRYALDFDEMYIDKGRDDTKSAKAILAQGMERAKQLKEGKPAWTTQTGLVVRGYRSKIDDSVQPYGLVVPDSWTPKSPLLFRADFWWKGRGETVTELNFIEQRQKSTGEFTPKNAFVIHPFGRYCNANKFAGEVDTFEVLEHGKKHYPIDMDRLVARGFSMGGAACWQFATHFPTRWIVAAPGAGFAETLEFLNNFQGETVKPTWYEERLWQMYNATDYALNIFNVPTIAYSGEIDKQKQAADVMARELEKFDIELVHIIGPKTAHKYEPNAKVEINKLVDAHADGGRLSLAYELKFMTHTLRYNKAGWLRVDGLEKHWEKSRIDGNFSAAGFTMTTKNVTAFTIDVNGADAWPGYLDYPATVSIDGTAFEFDKRKSDRSFLASFRKQGDEWVKMKPNAVPEGLHKVHGLQGPIDDAFMDKFIIVRPTGKSKNVKVGEWVDAEMNRAIREWRRVFRGDAIVKDDTAITDADIAYSHLIVWGDPDSNAVFAKIKGSLPLKWDGNITLGKTVHEGLLVPIMIYPNPLNPKKYVVFNSGFTFREYDALNNARQVPKLPDYALVDITTPPNSRSPGKVIRAGFFGEKWELLPNDGQ